MHRENNRRNLILIGMPGCGKSTLGVLLAKALGRDFLDTDILLQTRFQRNLQQILQESGSSGFLDHESNLLQSLEIDSTVVATGARAVLSEDTMRALSRLGLLVYLEVGLDELLRRWQTFMVRRPLLPLGTSMTEAFEQLSPLYQRYADITYFLSGTLEESLGRIVRDLGGTPD